MEKKKFKRLLISVLSITFSLILYVCAPFFINFDEKKKVKIEKMTQQSANLGSFVSSLYSEDYDLMSRSVIDQVVEPDRAVLIPEFDKVKMLSKDSGSIAAGISGSGPSIFSLSNNRVTSNNILDKISNHYNSMDIDFDGFISKVNSGGIKIIETK